MNADEQQQNDDSNNLDVSVDPFDELQQRYDKVKDTLYDNPTKSLDELIQICSTFCHMPYNEETLEKGQDLFLQALESLQGMIKKYQPTNQEKIDKIFEEFNNEDVNTRKQSSKENYTELLFDHYLTLTYDLKNEIKEVIDCFPKYLVGPIDTRILFVLTIVVVILYFVLKFNL